MRKREIRFRFPIILLYYIHGTEIKLIIVQSGYVIQSECVGGKQTDRQTDNHTQGRISAANLICISHQLALSWVVLVIRSVVLVCMLCSLP